MTTTIEGFTLGEPQVAGPLAVYPVLGPHPRLHYRAFAQTINLGALIKERDRGASVRELLVENPTDQPLLLYEGEEVLGAQQNRTFDVSVLVEAGQSATVPVSCVEAGRWDGRRSQERFSLARQAADPGLRRVKRARANAAAAAGLTPRPDQGEVWGAVSDRLATHAVTSDTAAMSDLYDARRSDLSRLASVAQPVEAQVGAVAQVCGRPVALDLVSRPEVFATLLPRLAQGYALDALGAEQGDPQARAAEGFLHAALEASRRVVSTPSLGRGFTLSTPGLEGAGLEHEHELIQLCAFPADHASESGPHVIGGRLIARPSRRRRKRAEG